jgi:hypothetical protein
MIALHVVAVFENLGIPRDETLSQARRDRGYLEEESGETTILRQTEKKGLTIDSNIRMKAETTKSLNFIS